MRTDDTRFWVLLASVCGLLLGGAIGCIVVAAMVTSANDDAGILSTSEISKQMERPVTVRVGVMTERLRTGVMTDRVRSDRFVVATVSGE